MKIILTIINLFIFNLSYSQNTFNLLFNHLDNQTRYDFCLGLDNSIVVSGEKSQQVSLFGNDGLFIAKLSSIGQLIYKKAYDTTNNMDKIESIITTTDSGFVCVGTSLSYSISGAQEDFWICKLDKNGNLVWSKTFDSGLSSDLGQDVIEAPDGSLIISGTADYNNGALAGDIYLMKLSSVGNMIWKKKIGISGTNQEGKFLAKSTNFFYISGYYGVYGTPQSQTVIAKVDYNGNIAWHKEFDVTGNNNAELGGISTTLDGGCLIATSNSLAKVDSNGNSVWSYFYSSTNSITISKLIALNNGMYLGCGTNSTFKSVLVKFDQSMNILWMKEYTNATNNPHELKEFAGDNSYLFISNSSVSVGNFSSKGTLIKTDTNGITTCNYNLIPLPYLNLSINPPTITNINSVITTTGYLYTNSTSIQQSTPTFFVPQCGGYDAGISQIITPSSTICTTQTPLTVKVSNFSSTITLPSIKIGYNLNGVTTNQNFNFQLLPLTDTIITIANINLIAGNNTLKVWALYDPILLFDNNSTNDTVSTVINSSNLSTPIIASLSSTTFCVGGQVVLDCTNNSTGLFQWYKDNIIINSATNQQYTATTIGSYKLIITSGSCIDSSNSILVVVDSPTSSTINQIACNSFTLNNQTYTSTGTYIQNLINVKGCDSILTLNLTINNLNNTVQQNSNILTAIQPSATYQWVRCPSYSSIPNETNQNFTASSNGDYAVIITYNGCTDTSLCMSVTGVYMNNYDINNKFILKPNPIINTLNITNSTNFKSTIVKIYTTTGNIVLEKNLKNSDVVDLDLSSINPGIYFLEILNDGKKYYFKIIKNG